MADGKWIMLRVRRETAARLRALITHELTRGGCLKHPAWLDGQELTVDRMISRLIDHLEKDRERSRRWGKTRQRRTLAADLAYLNDRYEINPAFEEALSGT